MIKIALFILLILNIFSFSDNNKKEELKIESYNVQNKINDNSVNFDFDGSMTSNTNIVDISIIDDYNTIPVITTDGNIGFELIASDYNKNEIRLTLPNVDGYLEITLLFGEISITRNIYSSTKNNVYAISYLSLYSAWELVGNIPGQEYMDNDSIEATFVETPEPSSERENNNRVIAEGSVFGYLRWTDDNNVTHPLIGAKVKLTWDGSFGEAYTYTNSSGYFYIEFHNMWTLWEYGCYIHIYAENEMCKVVNKNGTLYEKAEKLTMMQNGDNYNYGTYTFSPNQDNDMARAMQIFTAMKNYSDYAKTLNNNQNIPQCSIIYPTNSETNNEDFGSYYSNGSNVIHLGFEDQSHNGCPSVAGSWDVIGHEYGHHLQYHYFNQSYYGVHYYDRNDIYGYLEDNNVIRPTDNDLRNAKIQGTCLAFKEAWPTFFAIAAQNTFSSDIKTVPTVGDFVYESYYGVTQDLQKITNPYNPTLPNKINGESDEQIIMCFLYRLWESNNLEIWDNFSIGFNDIWNIMCTYNPANLSDFVNCLYSSNLDFSRSDLGELLEIFKVSASDLTINSNSLSNYSIIPSYSWIKNGQDIDYIQMYYYSNDKFSLMFYDANSNLIFEKQNIYSNSYTLSQDEWNQVLSSIGSYYYVVIKSYSTLGSETGPYYSQKYRFNIPSSATKSISTSSIDDSRYIEEEIAISQGTSWTFNITFNHSGNKLFQTFGNIDTKMWLYQSDGTTLVCSPSDDEGYSLNSLIYHYLYANTTYKLVVNFFNTNLSGMTKISVLSVGGLKNIEDTTIEEYENIFHIYGWDNYTLYSYVAQYESKVVTWTPNSSGNYTISLESEFDNFLYVINPSSSNKIINNVDYNDDEYPGIRNAKLTNYYDSSITYLIVFCQFNPSNIFDNLDTGDDIVVRISKNS